MKTVKELIIELQKLPPDLPVEIYNEKEDNLWKIDHIEVFNEDLVVLWPDM